MNNEIVIPNPLLDNRELDKIDQLTKEYEKYHEPGLIGIAMKKAGNSIKQVIPADLKNTIESMKQGISEADFIQKALGVVARGFTEIESRAAKLTVSKQTVVKRSW